MNEQHEWGGSRFNTTSSLDTGGQTLLASRPAADTDPSQVHFTASSSDNLFGPTTGGPSHVPPYILPTVPDFYRYNEPPQTPTVPHSFPYHFHPPIANTRLPSYDRPPHPPPLHRLHELNQPLPSRYPQPSGSPQPYIPYPPQHSYLPQGPLQYPLPPVQYIYLPAPPEDTPLLAPSSKSLPVITTIHSLNSKSDFYAWDEGVCTLLRLLGIHGHIVDPAFPVDPLCPEMSPALPPVLSQPPTPSELKALTRWKENDNVAQYVIVGRLGGLARQLLPSAYIGTRTAFTMYSTITRYFGLRNFGDCDELASSLLQLRCDSNRLQDYVARWHAGITRLCSAKYPFSVRVFINAFVKSLPNTITFATLRAFLPDRLASWNDVDIGPFLTITNEVMDLEVAFRNSHSSSQPRNGGRPPLAAQMLAPPPPLPTPQPSVPSGSLPPPGPLPPTARIHKPILNCSNCKEKGLRFTGHTDGTCFQPGGGMEGRREEYIQNKSRFHAMFVECLDNAFCDTAVPVSSPVSSPFSPPVIDDDVVIPPLANLCITSTVQNSDIHHDLYDPCMIKFPSPFACASIDFSSAVMVSMVSLYNALLDSGCTHHIIRDRALFHTYMDRPVSVGTANCGSLEALGTGDVQFRYPFRDRDVVFTLCGCLYAPSAPINLFSVGALVERGMSCLFSPGGITTVSYPRTHATLPGFAFSATVSNRLSFLRLDFISPALPVLPSALPAVAQPASSFPHVKVDSMLWHRRFGHLGMDATRAALLKNYVKGVSFEGSFLRDHCIPCLIGKSPQHSYSHLGHCAAKIGELLHMDICGPFPVQAPHGEKYFFSILDDKSNWGFTYGLKLKSDAFTHYLTTEAFLARSTGAIVLTIRCGGELELTAGRMGTHLTTKGIALQRTVPYAHQQNGKSERYIRTLEEGGQALLADAGLPMTFWLDAVLTRQYLLNHLPTSTLPDDTTPFEVITNGHKPDLSHLRVWGAIAMSRYLMKFVLKLDRSVFMPSLLAMRSIG